MFLGKHVQLLLVFFGLILFSYSAMIPSQKQSSQNFTGISLDQNKTQNDSKQDIKDDLQKIFLEDVQPQSSGCYISNPSEIGLNYKKAMVPLKSIDYNLEIVNSLVHVTLVQEYENPSNRFLSVYYSFPIRPESSLYRFEAKFGNVTVEGVVKQKAKAKEEFEKAKTQGRQAALGSINPDSKDIINLQIGNIPPRSTVNITISFIQELTLTLNTFYNLQVPSTISPRFMNSIPIQNGDETIKRVVKPTESTNISPMFVGTPGYTWKFTLNVQSSIRINFYRSPSHKLIKLSESENGQQIILSFAKDEIPNKDFTFLYTTQNFQLPSYVVGKSQNTTTIQVSFIPKFSNLQNDDLYSIFVQKKPAPQFSIDSVKGQYIFIIDRSGSMGGRRIQRARQSLSIFLRSLPPDSYFNVISFGSSYSKMYPQSIRYQNNKMRQAVSLVQRMQADFGGTQIYYPLLNAITQKPIKGYPRFIFLLTDGTVSNTEDLISMVRTKAQNVRVSSIGIGNGASSSLVEGTAKAGRGKFVMISDDEQPSAKIISLLESSLTPLITSINLKYSEDNLLSAIPNPNAIPYILKDSIVNIYYTYNGTQDRKLKFDLTYEDSVSKKMFSSTVEVDTSTKSYPFVDKMAHFKVLRALENLAKDTQANPLDYLSYKLQYQNFKESAVQYSIQYQILSEYTSFIALGKELVDSEKKKYKELGYQVVNIQQTKPVQYINQNMRRGSLTPLTLRTVTHFGVPNSAISPSSIIPVPLPLLAAIPRPTPLSAPSPSVFSRPTIGSNIRQALPQKSQTNIPLNSKQQGELKMLLNNVIPSPQQNNSQGKRQESQTIIPLSTQQQKDLNILLNQPIPSPIQNAGKQKQITINQVINLQNTDGSWSDDTLIQKLAKDPKTIRNLLSTIKKDIVITKLVLNWLEKQQAGSQYSLIIKKAQAWLIKAVSENKIDENKLKVLEVK